LSSIDNLVELMKEAWAVPYRAFGGGFGMSGVDLGADFFLYGLTMVLMVGLWWSKPTMNQAANPIHNNRRMLRVPPNVPQLHCKLKYTIDCNLCLN